MNIQKIFALSLAILQTSFALAFNQEILCPVNKEAIVAGGPVVYYKGLKVEFCCPGCDKKFEASPQKYLKEATEKNIVVAKALFDPIDQKRVQDDFEYSTSFEGVHYSFNSKDNKEEFDQFPGLYSIAPEREVLKCPVMGNKIQNASEASDFRDFEGIRYYFCCAGCAPKFDSDPKKYSESVKSEVKSASVGAGSLEHSSLAPTCAGCAGEARLLGANGKPTPWTLSYRYVGTSEVASRHRFSIDHMITPNLSVGLERSGSDSSVMPTSTLSDGFFNYLKNSDGDSPVLPRATWFASPERPNHPSVTFGFASDRLSTPRGQAFFATIAKSIPKVPVTPFVSVKTNTYGGRTVFPFGVNWYLPNNMALQAINDGDYSHLLLTKVLGTTSVSLLYARTQYWGMVVSYGF